MAKKSSSQKKTDLSIVLCGQAGMGVQTVEFLLTRMLKLARYNVLATKEYMSRVRGGTNSTEIRVSSAPVRAAADRIDILIPLNTGAVRHVEKRISPETVVLAEKLKKAKVHINKDQYFEGVQPDVWEFHIGGYQVCEKWLKDRRGREL